MTAQHTPEPWDIQFDNLLIPEIISGDKTVIPALRNADKDMFRIIACVNACAGVDTETLVAMANGEMNGSEIWELAKVKKQNAELSAQVADLVGALRTISRDSHKYSAWWAANLADEAIAKAGKP